MRRHLLELLGRNTSCEDALSFLGAGCYRHHVPAICDEIARRHEWLTSVWGTPSSDLGRFQAWFEYASQLGELLDLDFVGPARLQLGLRRRPRAADGGPADREDNGARPRALDPERQAVIANYCGPRAPRAAPRLPHSRLSRSRTAAWTSTTCRPS